MSGQNQYAFQSQGLLHHGGFGNAINNEVIRDFSNELGAGIVMGGDQSTSYIGTELIDFLRPGKAQSSIGRP